jgi:hypothetical protein
MRRCLASTFSWLVGDWIAFHAFEAEEFGVTAANAWSKGGLMYAIPFK